MPEGKTTYTIRGTKVTSPYPPELTPAECRLIFSLQKFFSPEMILADYYLPKVKIMQKLNSTHGNFLEKVSGEVLTKSDLLQIDCIAIDQRGIFVFESKDYVGWIYGHGDRVHWTQVSAYGQHKHQFYNPVKQNSSHITALRELCSDNVPIHSIIVFGREATLKVLTDLPTDCRVCTQTTLYHLFHTIPNTAILSELEVQNLRRNLEAGRINPNTGIRADHIEEIKHYETSTT